MSNYEYVRGLLPSQPDWLIRQIADELDRRDRDIRDLRGSCFRWINVARDNLRLCRALIRYRSF